jgi:16S rRNA G966 N2-methylase RsmD
MGKNRSSRFDYRSIQLIDGYIEPKKQAAKRHYGSHQFFTKRAWNVVQEYIKNFTQPGDTVLDPFGGSGVTAIEALILDRKAIHIDISPLSIFLAEAVAISPININALSEAYKKLKDNCEGQLRSWAKMSRAAVEKVPLKWWYPKDYPLPYNSDREFVHELFTRKQLLSLSYLLTEIDMIQDEDIRLLLRYNFAATLYKCNLTFLSAKGRIASRGGSSIFSIFRYKVADKPIELDVWEQFELRFRKLIACKEETNKHIGNKYTVPGQIILQRGSATKLSKIIKPNSVDYIFTDPPYGAHIAYLDLSAIWNAWLGFKVSMSDFREEVIEGGSLKKTSLDYYSLLDKSFEEMFKVLKYDRWISVVFAHKDPAYWDAVVKSAVRHGFQYVGTNVQPLNVVWSMHKKKNYTAPR